MKKKILMSVSALGLYLSIFIFLCSCSKNDVETQSYTINIAGYEDVALDFASLASKVDTLYFYVDENSIPVSMVQNIILTDSLLYVTDAGNCLSMFDRYSGKLLKQTVNIGRASHEYLGIDGIKCMNDTVYILDANSRKVIEYDKNLNYLGKVDLNFAPWDFEVTDDGFLFSRMDVAKDGRRFVHTDKRGSVLSKAVTASPFGEHIVMGKSLRRYADCIYLHELMSDKIYRWEDGNAVTAYTVSFPDSKEKDADGQTPILVKDYFVTSKHFICSFIYNQKQHYCIYSKEDGVMKIGSFDLKSGRPFSPIFQKGDSLVGIYSTEDIKALPNWKPQNEDCALTLFIYSF